MASYHIAVLILGAFALSAESANLNITSPVVTNWGDWGVFESCPEGTFVQGFQLKTEGARGPFIDDSAGNAVRLYCGDPFNSTTPQITSTVGVRGNWGSVFSCYPGYINGFQLRVEPNLGESADNTATNNMRVFCSNFGDPNQYIEGDGTAFGVWGTAVKCFSNQAFCAIQAQVQDCNTAVDCTSLNNLTFECCDHE